jgi:hypothetical protein
LKINCWCAAVNATFAANETLARLFDRGCAGAEIEQQVVYRELR